MKSALTPLLWLLLVAALWVSGRSVAKAIREATQWDADTTRVFSQVEVDRLLKAQGDSLNRQADSQANRLVEAAKRHTRSIQELQASNLRLRGELDSSTTTPESLSVALGLIETLQAISDSLEAKSSVLEAIIALRDSQMVRLRRSDSLGWAGVDSLSAVIRRTPKGCRLVLIPCPELRAGYGVTYADGKVVTGPSATFGWRVSF